MTSGRPAGLALGACAILALTAIGLAVGLIAWQERLASMAAESGAGPAMLATLSLALRLAVILLLIGLAASLAVAALVIRTASGVRDSPAAAGQSLGSAPAGPAALEVPRRAGSPAESPLPAVSLARVGHLVSLGGLIRGFCHQLNNELGPIQGYAELLGGDPRLSELHRRQARRIGDATRLALADIRSFGAVLGWSSNPGQVARLGQMAAEAARSAQAAMTSRIEVGAPTGTDVEVTATECEVGQAILHLCSAVAPLLDKQDSHLRIAVDSIVAAASPTAEGLAPSEHPLELWSDTADPARTRMQLGTLRPGWRYGRLICELASHGWSREQLGQMSDPVPGDEAAMDGAPMSLLVALMAETGGAITMDSSPRGPTSVILLWPARIAPEVGAPLELDAREDELDALIIHSSERTAEELSRALTALGLRVASTTSLDAAAELIAEMGPKCRAILLAQPADAATAQRLRQGQAAPRFLQLDAPPSPEELGRLARELRRVAGVSEPAAT